MSEITWNKKLKWINSSNNKEKKKYVPEKDKFDFTFSIKLKTSKEFYLNNKEKILEELNKELKKDKSDKSYTIIDLLNEDEINWTVDLIIIIKWEINLIVKYHILVAKIQKLIWDNIETKRLMDKLKKENEAIKILYWVSTWTYEWKVDHNKVKKKFPWIYKEVIDALIAKKTDRSLYREVSHFSNYLIDWKLIWTISKWEFKQNINLEFNFEYLKEMN